MPLDSKLYQDDLKAVIPGNYREILIDFCKTYTESLVQAGISVESYKPLFDDFFDLVKKQLQEPYAFEPIHQRVTAPVDYTRFGVEIIRPLVDMEASSVQGLSNVDKMVQQISRGENVILLANHQIEVDPQIIHLLLEKEYERFAEEMVFLAGHRVTTDPLAAPFSLGRNLVCIYSRKHLDNPSEMKAEKQRHNARAMTLLVKLLAEGGKCVYVAPSGGRDRPNDKGKVEVAPFDPQSIEMFRLIGIQSKRPTHFYPMAIDSYAVFPPPDKVQKELGEQRKVKRSGAHIAFCDEVDLKQLAELFPDADKYQRRQAVADNIWDIVKQEYARILS